MQPHLFLYSLLGILSGFYTATWGAFKDTPYEGFKTRSFVRSILIGLLCSITIYFFAQQYPKTIVSSLSIIFFASMGLERQLTEIYKGFIRIENLKKYKIPTYFGIYGKIINNQLLRVAIGIVFLSVFFIFLLWLRNLLNLSHIPDFIKIVIASSVGGIYVSLGGANKDAPYEGLDKLKIWRSEIIAVLFGFVFSHQTNDWIMLGYASIGAERFCIEFYKTYILKKKPGKFK